MKVKEIIDALYEENKCKGEELLYLLNNMLPEDKEHLFKRAEATRIKFYGNQVYLRGLIEFTNHCIRNCNYCGIRRDNHKAERYRLTEEEILGCAEMGDSLGYKTFVLQGGEDKYFTDERLVRIIKKLKDRYPNNAITLSVGERSYESYKILFQAGADRYLLRHETASKELYEKLHPDGNFENRIKCLYNLKEIGFHVGAGFMVGLPGQTKEDLVKDLLFLQELKPHMCGIGPFIPHEDTPLKNFSGGVLEDVIIMLALTRLLLPKVLLPATTALGTIDSNGREMGIKAGANVIMPNLSPMEVRKKYLLYNGKAYTGDEAAESKKLIEESINNIGCTINIGRGDPINN